MLKHTSVTLGRIRQFKDHQLADLILGEREPLQVEYCPVSHAAEAEARSKGPWKPVAEGFRWGPAFQMVWFRVTGKVPKEWGGREVVLLAELGGERTLWQGGVPERGIDEPHSACRLYDSAQGGEKIDLCLQAYSPGTHIRCHGKVPAREAETETMRGATLAVLHSDVLALVYDLEFGLSLLKALPEDDPGHATLLRALNDVCNQFHQGQPESLARCRKTVRDALGGMNGEVKHTITPVGHAHLDTAWLWPLRTTHLKMAHTTATQLYQLGRYPEYVFAHSQASQYEWLEKEYPKLLEKVKAAAKAGQWEPVGSMWVEADCNLTGAESLVRQFLYGRRYFEKHFGTVTDDMWLPDVFGYSAALPQIMQKFGIRYFLTQKISWNQFNKFPHNTFWWQGIDGTRIWSHFPPADTYNGSCAPHEILESVRKHKDQARSDQSLYVFGHGDGGGGPTELHLELLRRARLASCLPEIETKKRAVEFFREARSKSKDLATWVGELYLELHRGTYTSQAANKKGNRESEFLLRDAEYLSCFAEGFPKTYPAAKLEELWKLVLLNQFHDIIPGSSVTEVYQDSAADYAKIRAEGAKIIEEGLGAIGSKLDTSDMAHPYAVFQNATVGSQVSIPWTAAFAPNSAACGDERYPVQVVEEFDEKRLLFPTPPEALGAVAPVDLSEQPATVRSRLKCGPRRLENSDFAVRFDQHGNITSVLSLDDRPIEFIEPGKLANLFQILDDRPLYWDAWDVDAFAFETVQSLAKSESFEIVERGPVRVAAEVVKRFGKSTIRQRISLGPTPGIRFDTEIDWHEEHKFLKVAFPLNVNASRATFEIQFGNVERATHRNTSWDMAKFEVCAQKWVDLSEGGHGVALLNDGKYGHDVDGNVLRLSLLRSPKAPDPECDMGVHRFTYVLLPHFDQYFHADVVGSAYALNAPARCVALSPGRGAKGDMPKLVSCDNRNVVVETVKKAEDSNRLVVRLYECHNSRGNAELSCARGIKRAWLADLNEQPIEEIEVSEGLAMLEFKPFEILTVLLEV